MFNVITGAGASAGEALVRHPLVRKIAFTGSTPVGERIMALCAHGVKRLTLELGGSDPMIICDDADLAAAASAASMGRFYNCGQACLAIKRVYVFESVADEVIEAMVGRLWGCGSVVVKLTSRQPDRGRCIPLRAGRSWPARSRAQLSLGGELLAGEGRRLDDPELADGFFYSPTVVGRPAPRLADGGRGGVRARAADLARARPRRGDGAGQRLAVRPWVVGVDRPTCSGRGRPPSELEARLHVDQLARPRSTTSCRSAAWKSSGYGKEHGQEAFDDYTETKSVVMSSGS